MLLRNTVLITSVLFAISSAASAQSIRIQDETMSSCEDCHDPRSSTLPNPKLTAKLHHKTVKPTYQNADINKDDLMALLTSAE